MMPNVLRVYLPNYPLLTSNTDLLVHLPATVYGRIIVRNSDHCADTSCYEIDQHGSTGV